MKIIKNGLLSKTKKYKLKCIKCGTIFVIDKAEAKIREDKRNYVYFLEINCPSCKNKVAVDIIKKGT